MPADQREQQAEESKPPRSELVSQASSVAEAARVGAELESERASSGTPRGPYRVKEVAAALDVHGATIYRAIEQGELRALRIGTGRGTLKIPHAALVEYAQKLAQRATSPDVDIDLDDLGVA